MFSIKGRFLWQGEVRLPHSCNQYVRNGIFTDCSGFIPASISQKHFHKIWENAFFSFKNMKCDTSLGLLVSTQWYNEINEIYPFDIKSQVTENLICYPQVLNAYISAYPHLQQQIVQKEINNLSIIADLIVLVLFKKVVVT